MSIRKKFFHEGWVLHRNLLSKDRLRGLKPVIFGMKNSESRGLILEEDGKTPRSIFDLHNTHPQFISKFCEKSLVSKVESLLGEEVYIYQSHLNFKEAYGGEAFGWHSDYTYWKAQDGMETCLSLIHI